MINWSAHEKACISSFKELPTSLLSLGLFAFINEHRLFAWYRFETVQKQWVSGFYWFILKDGLGEHIITIFFLFALIAFVSLKSFITAQRHLKLIFLEDLELQSTGLLTFLCYIVKDWVTILEVLNSSRQRGSVPDTEGEREISHWGN